MDKTVFFLFFLQVDVFAYGIILGEIIGRIQADPDFLPRTEVKTERTESFKSSLQIFLQLEPF